MGKLSVFLEFFGAEVNVSTRRIGISLFRKALDDFYDFVNIFGCSRMNGGLSDIKSLGVCPKFLYIPLGNLLNGGALLVGLVYKLIVDVGEILNEIDLIASPLKVSSEHIKNAKRAGVSDVNIVIDGGAAGINFRLPLFYRNKLLFLSGQGIENFHFKKSFLSIIS